MSGPDLPADVTEAIYALISAAGRARMYAIEDDGLSPARARKSADSAAAERTCRDALVATIRAHLSAPAEACGAAHTFSTDPVCRTSHCAKPAGHEGDEHTDGTGRSWFVYSAKPQPPPSVSDSTPIVDLVIGDLRTRAETGRAKYGTYLRTRDGRDSLVDVYEELLDAAQYIRKAIEERAAPAAPPLTVGAALARPEVRLSGAAIEVDCPVWGWTQIVVDAGVIAWRTADTDPDGAFEMWPREWLTDEMRVDLLAIPCRLVPADEADLDPTTRSKT